MEASQALRGLRFELALLRDVVNDAFSDAKPAAHKVESANDHYKLVRTYLADCKAEIDRLLGSQRRLAIGADASLAMQVVRRGDREAWLPVAGRLDAVCSELLEILADEWQPESHQASAAPTDEAETELSLDERDQAILFYLERNRGATVGQLTICEALQISQRALIDRLKRLSEHGLTHRPRGEKSGEAITDKGIARLDALREAFKAVAS